MPNSKTLIVKSIHIIKLSLLLIVCLNTISASANEPSKIRLALFVDKGANARNLLRENLAKDHTLAVNMVDGDTIRNGCLNNIDVLFMPGGSGKKEAFSLGEEGKDKVRQFVQRGGIYIGVCAGCYLASCAREPYLGIMPATTVDKEHWRRGKAKLPISFTKLGMEIFGYPYENATVIYHNGPVLKPLINHAKDIMPLGYFRGEAVAKGGTPGLMVNAPAMVLCRYGNGIVLGISPHPEATPGLETIELNAIHWLYNHRQQSQTTTTTTTKLNIAETQNQVTYKRPPAKLTSSAVSNDLCARVYDKAEEIFEHTVASHYRHLHEGVNEQVEQSNGNYQITSDCSGFVSYVVNSIAPKHYAAVDEMTRRNYPHASIFARFFQELPENTVANGWLKINSFRNLKRGDLIAWERTSSPSQSGKKHSGSGHVMIIINPSTKIIQDTFKGNAIRYLEVYVLDSSSVEHFPPQSLPPLAHQVQRNGLGKGTIRLMLDNENNVIGFWEGTFSHEKDVAIKGPSYTNKIAFARLISIAN